MKEKLFALCDPGYRAFNAKLLPTVDPNTIIGVRAPQLRAMAKNLSREALGDLPHTYLEENSLHAYYIGNIKDFDLCIRALDEFLSYVDNWAVCDGLRPKCVKSHKQEFLPHIKRWLQSNHPYTIRFAVEMLMVHYLDADFQESYAEWVTSVTSNEYYVNMMIAWYFATALAKQYDAVIGFLEEHRLPVWVHNKTIQKAVESFRISEEQKQYLKSLKR